MITKLEADLRREVEIDGVAHVVTISPQGFLLTVKGRRKGLEIAWKDLVSGDAALATALNASLAANVGRPAAKPKVAATPEAPKGKATAGPKPSGAVAKRPKQR